MKKPLNIKDLKELKELENEGTVKLFTRADGGMDVLFNPTLVCNELNRISETEFPISYSKYIDENEIVDDGILIFALHYLILQHLEDIGLLSDAKNIQLVSFSDFENQDDVKIIYSFYHDGNELLLDADYKVKSLDFICNLMDYMDFRHPRIFIDHMKIKIKKETFEYVKDSAKKFGVTINYNKDGKFSF